jgi:redox-sensitive bicupin YhaK (pirin superfamily)
MAEERRKAIHVIYPNEVLEGAGVHLLRSFGPARANPFDPFLLFDHFAFNDPSEGPLKGFPMHPHRGIETVTYMLEGETRHADSLGNEGVIGPGDVQWMTSGGGIMHEEMPERGPGGNVRGFQLWVNLPAAEKMSMPRYREIKAGSIPTVELDGASVRLVAGTLEGTQGPVTEITAQPQYMDVMLEPGAEFKLAVPRGHTAGAYIYEGQAAFDIMLAAAHRMIVFGDGDLVRIKSESDSPSRFMFFSGAPFGEPIVPYGPFVMNTEAEIEQALTDLRAGTFVMQP